MCDQHFTYDLLVFVQVPELRMADHHPTTPAIPYGEGGELWQILYGLVDQVSQSAG